MPGTQEFIAAWLIVLGAGCVSGLAGFGFGLVSAPPLLLLLEPTAVVTVLKVLTLGTTWVTLLDARREFRPRVVLSLMPTAIAGLGAGVLMLKYFPASTIKLIACAVVIGFSLVLLRGIKPGAGTARWGGPLAGLASGTLSTSTGLSGPPIVMLFTLRGYSVNTFRSTIVAYFLLLDLIGFPTLVTQGLVARGDVILAATLSVPAILGRVAGTWLARRVSRATFYRVTLVLLLGTGLLGAITAAMEIVG